MDMHVKLIWPLIICAMIGCKTFTPGPQKINPPPTIGNQNLASTPISGQDPQSSYYFLLDASKNSTPTGVPVTLSMGSGNVLTVTTTALTTGDLLFITGEIHLAPQDNLSSSSQLAQITLNSSLESSPIILERNINIAKATETRVFTLATRYLPTQAGNANITLNFALDSKETPAAASLIISSASLKIEIYRSYNRATLIGGEALPGYYLVNALQTGSSSSIDISPTTATALQLPNINLQKGDRLLVDYAFDTDPKTLTTNCWGTSINAWLTLENSGSGLAVNNSPLAVDSFQYHSSSSAVLTLGDNDGIYNLRMKTRTDKPSCGINTIKGSEYLGVYVFRALPPFGTGLASGYYLNEALQHDDINKSLSTSATSGDVDLTASSMALNAADIVAVDAVITLASDNDFKETDAVLHIDSKDQSFASTSVSGRIMNGYPRLNLATRGFFVASQSPSPAPQGTAITAKASLVNPAAKPIFAENATVLLRKYRSFPVTSVTGDDPAGALVQELSGQNVLSAFAPSQLFKENTSCPYFRGVSGGTQIQGGPTINIPFPFQQFGGSLGTSGYTFLVSVGFPYHDASKPPTVYQPGEAAWPEYTQQFYMVTVANPSSASCSATAVSRN